MKPGTRVTVLHERSYGFAAKKRLQCLYNQSARLVRHSGISFT